MVRDRSGAIYDAAHEVIADYGCAIGEGPLWHEDLGALFWLDISAGTLYRYEPAIGVHGLAYQADGMIGGFTIQADGKLLLFGARGSIWTWDPETGKTRVVVEEIAAERGTRFNDVIADPEGRVYAGTMPDGDRPGRLYRLDPDGTLALVLADAGTSNGMGFTLGLDTLYHTNSRRGTIMSYRYDRRTGELGPGVIIVTVPTSDGVPDGLAVDREGNLWSARWNGGALFHYAPSGELLGSVAFPARKVSSVTFGGPAWRDVYVTCAGGDDKAGEGPRGRGPLSHPSRRRGTSPVPLAHWRVLTSDAPMRHQCWPLLRFFNTLRRWPAPWVCGRRTVKTPSRRPNPEFPPPPMVILRSIVATRPTVIRIDRYVGAPEMSGGGSLIAPAEASDVAPSMVVGRSVL